MLLLSLLLTIYFSLAVHTFVQIPSIKKRFGPDRLSNKTSLRQVNVT